MAKKKRKFTYKARSAESNKRRADQKGNKFASIFKENLQTFSTQDDNRIRIFPAGWDEAEHYGIDIYVHYGIGPDNQQFLCRKEMGKGSCPICEERQSNLASDPDYAFKLKATHRVAIWLLDRNDRKAGPKLWAMPWTVDRDVSQLAQDEDNGEVLPIDHPDDGYDVLFSMEGPKGGMKKYIGLKISRKPCAISKKESRQEEWLDFITENQVLDCLNYYSEEHITGCFGASIPDDDEEEDPRASRSKRKSSKKPKDRDDEDEQGEDEQDEDEEDEIPFDDEDEDEEEERSSRKKSKNKGKKKRTKIDKKKKKKPDPDEEDDDDEYDMDYEDEDEDDADLDDLD